MWTFSNPLIRPEIYLHKNQPPMNQSKSIQVKPGSFPNCHWTGEKYLTDCLQSKIISLDTTSHSNWYSEG